MHNTVAWVAIAVSIVSAAISLASYWTTREKLRLDLYDRRFNIYKNAAELHRSIQEWTFSSDESDEFDDWRDSPKVRKQLAAFRTSALEGHFLFDKESGVPEMLEKMATDAFYLSIWEKYVAFGGPVTESDERKEDLIDRSQSFLAALEPLREKVAPFLNFHSYSALPRLFDENGEEW
jgi:hypothetical protein